MPPAPKAPHFSKSSGLAYHEFGHPQGRPVVFLHGWPAAGSQGRLFHEDACELGLRILSPNRMGIAGSEGEAGHGFSSWPTKLELFLDDLGIEKGVSLLGMSGGAPYTLAAAHALPGRLKQVGIICGAGEIEGPMDDMAMAYRIMAYFSRRAPWALGGILKMFHFAARFPGGGSGPGTRGPGLCRRDRLALADPKMKTVVAGGLAESMSGSVGAVVREGQLYLRPWDFDPGEIQIPVSFWHGRLDRNITPRVAETLASRIPGSELVWFDEEGHYSLAHFHPRRFLEEIAS